MQPRNLARYCCIDIEMTGLKKIDRIVSFAAYEMNGDQFTGEKISFIVNPEKFMSDKVIDIHHITNEYARTMPLFPEVAGEIYKFLGKDPVVIFSPQTHFGEFTDEYFLNTEMELAGFNFLPPEQYINAHTMSKSLHKNPSLNSLLDFYGIDRTKRKTDGHSAEIDAQLLSLVFPSLYADYQVLKYGIQTTSRNAENSVNAMSDMLRKLSLK